MSSALATAPVPVGRKRAVFSQTSHSNRVVCLRDRTFGEPVEATEELCGRHPCNAYLVIDQDPVLAVLGGDP